MGLVLCYYLLAEPFHNKVTQLLTTNFYRLRL